MSALQKQGWKTCKQMSELGDEKQTTYNMQMIPPCQQKTRKIRSSWQKVENGSECAGFELNIKKNRDISTGGNK